MNKNSIVGFIDLLGTKSSARVSDRKFDEMLFHFYQAMVLYLGVDESPRCRAKIFNDCAYFYIEDFDEEYAKKLTDMREFLFSKKHFFKCAIVNGSYEEADAARIYQSKSNSSSANSSSADKFMTWFVDDFLQPHMESRDSSKYFWSNFSLVHFGQAFTDAYFHHEDFKGMGYSIQSDVVSGTEKRTGKRSVFVESCFPSNATPLGYKKFFDIRYPKGNCIAAYYFNNEQTGTDEAEFRDQLFELYRGRQEVNPERINSKVFHEDHVGFIRGVIESMYLASLKKKEYAQYYCSILNSLIVTSNFSLLYYTPKLDGATQAWSLFPEVFYELILQEGVLTKLCNIETFDLVLLVLVKEIASELLRREKIANEKAEWEISKNAQTSIRALMLALVRRVDGLPAKITGRYSNILSSTEKSYVQAALAYVSGPYVKSDL